MSSTNVALMGEAMLELSHPAGQGAKLSFGGDVLNTSIYLARLGVLPHLITALGYDPYSDGLIKDWERECVQTTHVLRDPERLPGLYAIQTDHQGERSFFYWRNNSAAKNFFNLEGSLQAVDFMKEAGWLYMSGITLSIFNEEERAQLVEIAKDVKAKGGEVAFDPNYRPIGWSSHKVARGAMEKFAAHATLMLATIDDENLLYGQMPGEKHASRWHDLGVDTVILKCGSRGAIIYERGHFPKHVPVSVCEQPVDTTGAGDSFNAAFIAMKCIDHSTTKAVQAGNLLASHVIQYPGAIIPLTEMPDLYRLKSSSLEHNKNNNPQKSVR